MAISTYATYLLVGSGDSGSTTYSELVPIKDYPEIFGAPEQLETTTLEDDAERHINGISKQDSLEFTFNYTKEDFTKLKGLEGKQSKFKLAFGDQEGKDGTFMFEGELTATVSSGAVNAVREGKITISVSSKISFS